ncbi:hypothetical protein HDZ31DRAFT_62884 [Schizophyllum fasciatum]
MSTTQASDMTPQGLLNDDGNYILQKDDMYNLLKYVWAGVLLPKDTATYQARVQVSAATYTKISGVVTPLLATYAVVQGHCQVFKSTTYPSIVGVANDVYNYAQDAGGAPDVSYYGNIFQSIRTLSTTTSQSEQSNLKQVINSLVDTQVQNISAIQEKAKALVEDLIGFKNQTLQDQAALKERKQAVDDALSSEVGNLDDLQADLKSNKIELQDDEEELERDKIIACTTLTYAWIPFVGIIAASIVAGLYGSAAAKMADKIDALHKLLVDESGKIQDEKSLIADLTAVDTDLQSLLDAIEPAIKTLQAMSTIWQDIATQLTNLRDMVNTDVRKANAIIATIEDAKLVDKWNTLARAVDRYRQAAYISPIQQTTLDDLSQQLHKQAAVDA